MTLKEINTRQRKGESTPGTRLSSRIWGTDLLFAMCGSHVQGPPPYAGEPGVEAPEGSISAGAGDGHLYPPGSEDSINVRQNMRSKAYGLI